MSAPSGPDPQQQLEKTLARLRSRGGDKKTIALLESLSATLKPVAPAPRQTDSMALLGAATRASFTVAELREAVMAAPGGEEPSPDQLSVVLNDSLAVAGLSPDTPPRYILFDSAREIILGRWQDAAALSAMIEAASKDSDLETRFVGTFLQDPLAVAIDPMSESEMLAAAKAAGMLVKARPNVEPVLREMRRRLDLEEVIGPLRVLIGRRSPVGDGMGPDAFVGRELQLRELYGHVGIRPPETLRESAGRLLKSAIEAFTGSPTGALVVHGIGGMGKSALMARFVLEHVRRDQHWLPFAYLDFDRSTLVGAGPVALLIEIIRQVGLEIDPRRSRPEAAAELIEALRRLRADLRADLSKGATWINEERIARFRQVIDRFSGERPFLLVLDTVERLQLQGSEAVGRLQGFLAALGLFAGSWQRLRVVACSRMDVPELREFAPTPTPVALQAMDPPETRNLTRAILGDLMPGRSVASELIGAISDAAKGYPLFVRVLATHVARANLHDDQDLIRELQSTKGRAARVATVFYTRFADRVALPGGAVTFKAAACLTIVTPERLESALRGTTLTLTAESVAEAFRLLHDDGTLWAERTPTNLRWRPELRVLMLGCIRDENQGPSGALQRIAGTVADGLGTPANDEAAADAVYYTLLADRGVTAAHGFWRSSEAFRGVLAEAAQDFPPDSLEATYLRLLAARRRPDDQQLQSLPGHAGWQLAWDADPRLAKLGGEAVDRGVVRLIDLAPRIERTDHEFEGQRFALLAKTGRWREARHHFSDEITGSAVDPASLLHWFIRADGRQMREQVPRLAKQPREPTGLARARGASSEAVDTAIATLVATRIAGSAELFTMIDRVVADLPVGRLAISNLSTTILLAGSFGEYASDWAVEAAALTKGLGAVSSTQVAMLTQIYATIAPNQASRLDRVFPPPEIPGALQSLTDGDALAVIVDALEDLRKQWTDVPARRAFFRAFFGQRNPDWIEPFAYTLASIFEAEPRREAVLLASVESLADDKELDSQLVSRAKRRSHRGDATDLLRMMDEAGALPRYLAVLDEAFTAEGGILSRSISSVRSVFGQADDAAQERIADFSDLVGRFGAWRKLKEQNA